MKASQAEQRLKAKTPIERFQNDLEKGYGLAPRVAATIAADAQHALVKEEPLDFGQRWVVLVKRSARHGQPLADTARVEVCWTIDNGVDDQAVRDQFGAEAQRQVRIQRLLDEALEQGGVATQEDLARVLNVSKRTIQRDMQALSEQGLFLPTRGYLQGIGRGQSHKGQIIRLWLQGRTYDQLVLDSHHCLASIQRYVQSFLQVVRLQRKGHSLEDIQVLLQMGGPLIEEYLRIAADNEGAGSQARLSAELARTAQSGRRERGGP